MDLSTLSVLKERRSSRRNALGESSRCVPSPGSHGKPRLLLLDELSLASPRDGGPPRVSHPANSSIERISIFLVEQDVQIALELASRGYVIETGKIVAEGTSANLLSDNRIRKRIWGSNHPRRDEL